VSVVVVTLVCSTSKSCLLVTAETAACLRLFVAVLTSSRVISACSLRWSFAGFPLPKQWFAGASPVLCARKNRGDFCLLAALKWCSLASAEAVARVLLFGALCSQKSVTLVFSHLKWCSLASAETMARFAPLRRVRSRRVGVDFSQLATVPICWPPLP
jgi:hypothetical protein